MPAGVNCFFIESLATDISPSSYSSLLLSNRLDSFADYIETTFAIVNRVSSVRIRRSVSKAINVYDFSHLLFAVDLCRSRSHVTHDRMEVCRYQFVFNRPRSVCEQFVTIEKNEKIEIIIIGYAVFAKREAYACIANHKPRNSSCFTLDTSHTHLYRTHTHAQARDIQHLITIQCSLITLSLCPFISSSEMVDLAESAEFSTDD